MVLDIPLVVVDALVRLAPLLTVASRAARLLAWADDWYASWLVLAGWCLLCLVAPALFRYAVPLLLALLVFLVNNPRPPPSPLITDTVLQAAITNLATVATALPSLSPANLAPRALFRAAAFLTLPWLVLTHLLRTRLLLALIGSLFIVRRAPWASVLVSVLWRSAFVRAALHAAHAFLTGQPLPRPLSFTTTTSDSSSGHTLRFLITVHENQRWWVGLDWTAALIPSERPAWSSPALLPVSPPAAFVLPDPATVYLPAPDAKFAIKRTATWKWLDPEWRLLVRTPGSSLSRISRSLPTDDPSSPSSPSLASSASRLFKPTSLRIKASSSQPSPPQDDNDNGNDNDHNNDDDDSSQQPSTDPDGWIYSDNKWENHCHSNSLGKVGYHLLIHTFFPHQVLVHPLQTVDPYSHCQRTRPIRSYYQHRPSTPSNRYPFYSPVRHLCHPPARHLFRYFRHPSAGQSSATTSPCCSFQHFYLCTFLMTEIASLCSLILAKTLYL